MNNLELNKTDMNEMIGNVTPPNSVNTGNPDICGWTPIIIDPPGCGLKGASGCAINSVNDEPICSWAPGNPEPCPNYQVSNNYCPVGPQYVPCSGYNVYNHCPAGGVAEPCPGGKPGGGKYSIIGGVDRMALVASKSREVVIEVNGIRVTVDNSYPIEKLAALCVELRSRQV